MARENPQTSAKWKIAWIGVTASLLIFLALEAWLYMPIYPDEIAFRVQRARALPDHFVMPGLYPLCRSASVGIPFLFRFPGFVLSVADQWLSPSQWRFFPIATVFAVTLLTVYRSVRGNFRLGAAIIFTSFVGVAGSSLVLARYEVWQEANIACCLIALSTSERWPKSRMATIAAITLLLASSLLSVYTHMQGLLFLPLTAAVAYTLLAPRLGHLRAALSVIIIGAVVAVSGLSILRVSCPEYPAVDQFFSNMTIQPSDLGNLQMPDWIVDKFPLYASAFTYNQHYTVDYLHGLDLSVNWLGFALMRLNPLIATIVIVNLALCIILSLAGATSYALRLYNLYVSHFHVLHPIRGGALKAAEIPSLIGLPVTFLFFYDSSQNFYREIFMNLLVSTAIALLVSKFPVTRRHYVAKLYILLNVVVVITSVAANNIVFGPQLSATPGYVGPGTSVRSDWSATTRDVKMLAITCRADLNSGRIIFDDLTYNALKTYHPLYAITYLSNQADVTGVSLASVVQRLKPNYALARCSVVVDELGPTWHGDRDLCCVNFRR